MDRRTKTWWEELFGCRMFHLLHQPVANELRSQSKEPNQRAKKSKAEAGWEMDLSRIRDSNGGGNRRRPGRSFTGRRSQEERARPITRDGETHRRL